MSATSAIATVNAAVSKICKAGIRGQRPLDEIERLDGLGAPALEAMGHALGEATGDELTAVVHLVRLMRASDLATQVADAALRRPAPMVAKIEAVESFREWGIPVPSSVEDTLRLFDRLRQEPTAQDLARVRELPEAWRLPVLEAMLDGPVAVATQLLTSVLGIDRDLDTRVVDLLGRSGSADAVGPLRAIEAGDDRTLKKAAKRALHQLRSQGVAVDTMTPTPASTRFSLAITPDTRHETLAFSTGVDGAGGWIVWVLTPSAQGGERLLEAVIDDSTGLRRAETMSVTRRGFRQHVERLRDNRSLLIVQIDALDAASMLLSAQALGEQAGGDLLPEFVHFRDALAPDLFESAAGRAPWNPIPAEVCRDAAADGELLATSVGLLALPCFSNWALLGDPAERAAAAVRQAETSQLALDDEQRKDQVDRAISGAAEAIDGAMRARFGARLELMARMLWNAKQKDHARQALAAAAGFASVAELYSDHPFARGLVQRGVMVAYQHLREHEDSDDPDAPRIVEP